MKDRAIREKRLLALTFVLILPIPLIGAWHYVREYRFQSIVGHVDIVELQAQRQTRVQQCVLDGFAIPVAKSVSSGIYEYLPLTIPPNTASESGAEWNPRSVLLRRRKSLEGTLQDRATEGIVAGRIFPGLTLSRCTAQELEQAWAEFDASNCLIFEVDCRYLNAIAWSTAMMTIYAAFVFTGLFGWLSWRYQKETQRRDRNNCTIELQLAMFRQESFCVSS